LFPVSENKDLFLTTEQKEKKVIDYLAKAKVDEELSKLDVIILQNLNKETFTKFETKVMKIEKKKSNSSKKK